MIPVTQPHLPDRNRLARYIDGIYERNWLTNDGPLVQQLTGRLEDHLGVDNLLLVANGTLALQIAYRVLGITKAAVTTPFSFVATTSSLVWEGITPQFADIDPATFCLEPQNVCNTITADTQAIVPVHVYGNGCDVETLEAIARENHLKLIYDGAHAFGVNYKGNSILSYGDAATLSFHATKLFHSVEGGAIIFKNRQDLEKAQRLINFGFHNGKITAAGINAKMSEFHAAMGLAVLDEIEGIQDRRAKLSRQYEDKLAGQVQLPVWNPHCTRNHAYFPVLLRDESILKQAQQHLNDNGFAPRRYFHPSLDTLNYVQPENDQPNAQDIASRILCLPGYSGLSIENTDKICQIIVSSLNS